MRTRPSPPADVRDDIALLYITYRQQIFGYLVRLLHNREIAEDLCQDTFLKAWSGWEGHDPAASTSAWLYRIATNTAYDYARRNRRIQFLPLGTTEQTANDATQSALYLDTRASVQQALEDLSELDRLSLVLSEHAGYSAHEIGTMLGYSDGAIRTRLHRARTRFQQVYGAAQAGIVN